MFSFILFFLAVPIPVEYPYPVQKITVTLENKHVQMAYMDVKPPSYTKTVVLLHGKNFNGYYWKNLISVLEKNNYRVIVPDQPGWGKSDKPDLHYSFHLLANGTSVLLDSLKANKVIVVGHSMGGMLAARFAMQFPERVEKLVLENPIGLEDYKRFVPWQSLEKLFANEKKATYESYKQYQRSYYPTWHPEYEQYVQAQAEALKNPDFEKIAWVNALTYQMIYEQPVCYEWDRILAPVLLIIGQLDRTVVGKALLNEEQKKQFGQYPQLGKKTLQQLRNGRIVEMPGVGHIPHIQEPQQFQAHLLEFLKN
jgi:pimeloyl-ACP methyl ester carboxylesterase